MWAGSAVIAFFVARNVPAARTPAKLLELSVAIVMGLLCGLAATALDFGGWQEMDWRAGALCFVGAMAGLAAIRLMRIAAAQP